VLSARLLMQIVKSIRHADDVQTASSALLRIHEQRVEQAESRENRLISAAMDLPQYDVYGHNTPPVRRSVGRKSVSFTDGHCRLAVSRPFRHH